MKGNLVVIGIVVLMAVGVWVHATFFPPKGIIAYPGYEHAVAFCGAQEDPGLAITKGDATITTGRNYHMVINAGHEGDQQVINLKAMALVECDSLMGKENK